MRHRTVLRLALSIGVFVVCAEAVGLVAYFAESKRLFYLQPRSGEELAVTPEDRDVPSDTVHPYFGFSHRPGVSFHDERFELLERSGWRPSSRLMTNNFGFISPYAYPLQKMHEDEFFIGIFGGSVGMWFCQLGTPTLIERLQQHPFFRPKRIVPLCFSYSGYKQPQLALILAYFLSIGQAFDLVVNIDGFNDVALGALNDPRGFDISMPSVQHLEGLLNLVNQSTLTPEKLESLVAVFRDRARLIDLSRAIRDNRSAAIDFVLNAYYGYVRGRYTRELSRFANLPSNQPENSLVRVTPPVAPREPVTLFQDIASVWTRSSLLMRELLASRGAAYVHVLQPNQYYTARTFSAAGAATALTAKSPYKQSVERGYPLLQAAGRSVLRKNGVAFFDASGVLDREPSPVYLDDCCHYTVVGNRVLADFIAASILGTSGPWHPLAPAAASPP